ncbi:hypothetical protein GCM10023196_037210 [Actinoallomurus vinaceus]|uniref:Phosphoadenosine phosphosulphate reductase domain-containing protein n=1 Tax=Actinoallomurus vinaceus TaxID=1080074 RepID=A0ABP8U9H7_9ACTN
MARKTLPPKPLESDVYTLACERTARIFDTFDHVYVAFSGGKDSTAVLNVALEVAHSDPRFERHLPLRVVHQDEEAIPYETEEYVRRVGQRDDVSLEWYCIPIKHRNACSRTSPWWWPWAPEAREKWCRPLPPEAITELDGFPINPPEKRLTAPHANGLFAPPSLGNVGMLMGIRAQESLTRRRIVTQRREVNYLVKYNDGTSQGNIWKCYPIYDWTTDDVWTAPAHKGWDYNHAYDRLEMAGVSHHLQRCSPAFGEEPLQKLHTYAKCFPDVWEKMVDRVPGVGAAARYALTELYSYHGRPEKPDGVPWPDFLRHYLTKWQAKDAAKIAARIRQELVAHYRKTSQPLVVNAPHPDTGISWDFLLMLVMRGDFKGRKQAGGRINTDGEGRPTPAQWHRYAAELNDIIAAGTFADLAHHRPPPADAYDLVPDYAKDPE